MICEIKNAIMCNNKCKHREYEKEWLTDNGFIYGQRSFFNYPTGDKEWFHKDDISMEYVDVVITKMNLDDQTESKFKNFGEMHREWLPKFLKELKEAEAEEE